MRLLQRLSKFGFLLLLTFTVGTAAYGQTCDFYLNVTDGSDLNDGLTPTTAWQSFENAWDNATDGSTVCTAAGEYFQSDDNDGIFLADYGKSVTFAIDTFASNDELRFPEKSFEIAAGAGNSVTITGGTASNPTVYFGDGFVNDPANFPGNQGFLDTITITSGTLSIDVPTTIDDLVVTINRDTEGSFDVTPTYSTANRTITITGDDTVDAGGELPTNLAAGTLTINTTAGTYTSSAAHTLDDGGMLMLTGTGNATFSSVFTVSSAGGAMIMNTNSGTLAFDGGLVVNASADLGAIVDNQADGAISASSTTFNHVGASNGTAGDNDFTATVLNSGTGTVTTGSLTDVGNGDPDRVLVTTDNATTGTFNVGGDTASTVGGDLMNNGTYNLWGDLLLEGDLNNVAGSTVDTGGYTLSLDGTGTYANAGDVTGSGTVDLLGTATVDVDGLGGGTGGTLPNVTVTDGDATVDASQITGTVTINSSGTHSVNSAGSINGDLVVNGAASVTTVTTASGIDGNVDVTGGATLDVNGPDVGGTTSVASGVTTFNGTTSFGGDVSTSGGGGITFNGLAGTTISGNLTMGGTGAVTNTAGTPLTVTGMFDLMDGTFTMGDDVSVTGAFMQVEPSTFDFGGANTLSLTGDFTRTGGTVIRATGMLSFIGQGDQVFQGGPNFTVYNAEIQGLGTHVIFEEGSLEVENDFTIGINASMDLGDRLIRLIGLTSTMLNDGSYTSGPDGKVIFAGPAGAAQTMEGNGLYGNIEISQAADDQNVTINAINLEITQSGTLTFLVGGIDLNGQAFDLSMDNGMPVIRRNLANQVGPDVRPDGSDGGFFTGAGTFNTSGTAYDLEYFGAQSALAQTGTEWDNSFVNNVTVSTSGFATQLDADHSFAGALTVDGGADLDMNGFTLTSTGTDVAHTVAGAVSGASSFDINGSGSIGGSGTVSTLTVNSSDTFDINTLAAIGNLNVTSGMVSVGLDADTADDPDTAGDIDNYNQTGGDVSLTTSIDIGENAGAGTFNVTDGTFAGGDWDVYLYNTDLTSDAPASFNGDGSGYFNFLTAGTLNNDVDGDFVDAKLPRLMVDAGTGNTVTLNGYAGVTDRLTHTTGDLDLNGMTFNHDGTEWNYAAGAGGYGATGTFAANGELTANLDQDVTLPNLSKNTTSTLTLTGDASTVEVTTLFTMNDGTVDQGGIDILLTNAGTAFDFNAGSFMSSGGELVFDAGAAQTFTFADGLDIPFLRIEDDVTADGDAGTEVFNVSNMFTFGENNSDLLFADSDGNISFSADAIIVRDGDGTIQDATVPEPQTPVFPDDGWVDVHYLAAVTTDTELPGDPDDLGYLLIDPGAGDVVLDKAATANEGVDLMSGNLNTTDANTLTIADGGSVMRSQGTVNDDDGNGISDAEDGTGDGSNLQGTSWTLTYDTSGGAIVTQSGEYPEGVDVALVVTGDTFDLDLHAPRTATSLEMTLVDAGSTYAPLFDLNGWDFTVTGDATINDGELTDSGATFTVDGNLMVGADDPDNNVLGAIDNLDVVVGGDATIDGHFDSGTLDVDGSASLNGTFTNSDLVAAGDVAAGPGIDFGGANLTFNGFQQMFTLNGDIDPAQIIMSQTNGDGQPWVMVEAMNGPVTIDLSDPSDNLELNNGLLITGDNPVMLQSTAQGFTHDPADGDLSHVVGTVGKAIFQFFTGRLEYPVGSEDAYRLAAITFESGDPAITASTIFVQHVDERPAGLAGFPIGPIAGPADFYWLLTASTSLGAAQTFDLEFLGSGFTDFDKVEDIRVVRRLDGDVQNTWEEQGGTYDNFLTEPPDNDPLVRVTSTAGGLVAQGSLFTFGVNDIAGISFLQVVHAAASTDFSEVDVYIDDMLTLNDLTYREATSLIAVDVAGKGTGSTGTFAIDVAPSNSTSSADAFLSADVELTESQSNVAVVLDDGAGNAQMVVATDVETVASDPTLVDVALLHGVSDAGALDVRLFEGISGQGPLILENVGFGESSDGYVAVDAGLHTLEFLPAGSADQAFATSVDMTGLEGEAVMAIAHGFMNPPVGQSGSRGANVMVVQLDGTVRLGTVVTANEEEVAEIPTEFALDGNYPNPFNPSTTIQFDLPETAEVTIQVIDMLGRQVLTVPRQTMEAGAKRTVRINAINLASGTYLYRLTAIAPNQTWVSTGTMTLIK
ncbi:T9SS type A sorting domain-containing protein [Rhodocaloribacter sp.]